MGDRKRHISYELLSTIHYERSFYDQKSISGLLSG